MTGCNMFRKEDMDFRIRRARASTFAICRIHRVKPSRPSTFTNKAQGLLASDSSTATDTPGEACSHVHSRLSLSFKARRRSGTERSRAASGDIVVVADQSDSKIATSLSGDRQHHYVVCLRRLLCEWIASSQARPSSMDGIE